MAKADIVEQHSKSISGTLDLDNMKIECETVGAKFLKDLLSKFNSEYVTISVKLKAETEE